MAAGHDAGVDEGGEGIRDLVGLTEPAALRRPGRHVDSGHYPQSPSEVNRTAAKRAAALAHAARRGPSGGGRSDGFLYSRALERFSRSRRVMGSRGSGAAAAVAASIALALVLLLPGLGAAPFDDPGEGQHAEIAREIRASGDWLDAQAERRPLLRQAAPPLLACRGGLRASSATASGRRGSCRSGARCSRRRRRRSWAPASSGPGRPRRGGRAPVVGAVRRLRPLRAPGDALRRGHPVGPGGPPAGPGRPREERTAPRLAPRGLRGARARLARQGSARAHRPARGHRPGPGARRPAPVAVGAAALGGRGRPRDPGLRMVSRRGDAEPRASSGTPWSTTTS